MSFDRLEGLSGLLGWGIKSGIIQHADEEFEFRVAIEHEYTYNEYHDNDLNRIITEPIAESHSYVFKTNEHFVDDWKVYSSPNAMIEVGVEYVEAVKHADEICMKLNMIIPKSYDVETMRRNALLAWLNNFVYDERTYRVSKMSVPDFHRFVSIIPMYRNSEDAFGEALTMVNLPPEYVDGLFKQQYNKGSSTDIH